MQIPAPSAHNKRGGKFLPGPRQSNFLITTIIYSSSPSFFLAPRFWEPRGHPQPGFSLEARERVLGKRLLNGDGIENSKKENKTTTTICRKRRMFSPKNLLLVFLFAFFFTTAHFHLTAEPSCSKLR